MLFRSANVSSALPWAPGDVERMLRAGVVSKRMVLQHIRRCDPEWLLMQSICHEDVKVRVKIGRASPRDRV